MRRRPTPQRALAPALALVMAIVVGLPGLAGRRLLVTAVQSVGMTVSDADRAALFYSRVLSFEKVSDVEISGRPCERLEGVPGARLRVVRMRLGEEMIDLTQYVSAPGRPFPADSRSNDRWFQHAAIIVRDMDAAYAQLHENGVRDASVSPQRLPDWNPNAGGIRALYFRDPDDHFLEILQFPAGKGDAKWHRASGRLFLGIDHTAIVVADTDASLKFYRDRLGLRVAGESDNYGIEQERLNGVAGAHLRITALRAAHGPGIELLEYLSPRDGRPSPRDRRPNDLAYWQTTMSAVGLVGVSAPAPASGRIVTLPAGTLGFERGVLVRDPDGHALRLVGASRK